MEQIIWNFFFYSMAGFWLEIGYARLTRAEKQDRKCRLFLPICPVYGVGASAIVLLPEIIKSHIWLLMPAAIVTATAAEAGAAIFYEKFWGVRFWDYQGLPGNWRGRVCLPYSAAWGLLSLPLVYWIHPQISALTGHIPAFLLPPVAAIFLLDFWITGILLRRSHSTNALIWYR